MDSYWISPYQINKTSAAPSDTAAGFSLVFLELNEWEQLPKLLATRNEQLPIERFSEIINYQKNPSINQSESYLLNIIPRVFHLGPNIHYILYRDVDNQGKGKEIAFFMSPAIFIFVSWPENIRAQITRWAKRGILDSPLNLANLLAIIVLDHHQDWLDHLENKLMFLEKDILQGPQIAHQNQIVSFHQHVLTVKKSVNLHRPVLARLRDIENTDNHGLAQEMKETAERVIDTMQNAHDMVENLRDAYQTAVQNHTNDIMKILSIMATVLLPINLFTSFFGMNFYNMPLIHNPYGLITFFTASALVIFLAIFFFYRRGYFRVWNIKR
ncbi:CorA family divalent cation transporter [Desulfosporosinus sp. PR]|uniref:CorA family divalent cation transporter n=1 Tax=Candidatus Desulfosporosinus nitrosoreducens TaxID=3401928 RepID=UPI0027F48D2E|nr:CorA family divalent cation transporter [Desulfosporosinus sp. PR]MDQ7096367.1 CorA family divalent cation transporter [Desulfosporosinus sp. PR]